METTSGADPDPKEVRETPKTTRISFKDDIEKNDGLLYNRKPLVFGQSREENEDEIIDMPDEESRRDESTQKTELRLDQIYVDPSRPHSEDYNCMMSMVYFAVGLSNIWKFPYLCFKHGGISFLIVYFFFLIICAMPVMYLEVIVGQFTQSGMIDVWKIVPIFRGIGYCQVILPMLISWYYNAVYAWALLYCAEVLLSSKIPWASCSNDWNTLDCRDIPPDFEVVALKENERRSGVEYFRGRIQEKWKSEWADDEGFQNKPADASIQFGLAEGDLGLELPGWRVIISLCIIYVAVFIFVHRGLQIKGYSKSLIIAVTAPYICMEVLMFRAIGIPGSFEGLGKFIYFNNKSLTELKDFRTWEAAALQAFFSCSAGIGIHLTYASYNKLNHNLLRDVIVTTFVDTITGLFGGIIIFVYVGSVANSDGIKDYNDVLASGPELVFEILADALGRLPGASFFSFVFYFMVLLTGFSSTLGGLICAKESFFESFGFWFDKYGETRGIFVNTLLIISYLVGIACLSRGGIHTFIFLDHYSAGIPMLLCGLLTIIAIAWFYGLKEICKVTEAMTGRKPGIFFQVSWKFVSPICLLIIIAFLCQTHDPHFTDDKKNITFNQTFILLGQIYSSFPNILIFIGVFVYWYNSPGKTFKQKLLIGISPDYEHEAILATGKGKRAHWRHYWDFDLSEFVKFRRTPPRVHPENVVLKEE